MMDAEISINKDVVFFATMLVCGLERANSESQTGEGDSLRAAINVSEAKLITAR